MAVILARPMPNPISANTRVKTRVGTLRVDHTLLALLALKQIAVLIQDDSGSFRSPYVFQEYFT